MGEQKIKKGVVDEITKAMPKKYHCVLGDIEATYDGNGSPCAVKKIVARNGKSTGFISGALSKLVELGYLDQDPKSKARTWTDLSVHEPTEQKTDDLDENRGSRNKSAESNLDMATDSHSLTNNLDEKNTRTHENSPESSIISENIVNNEPQREPKRTYEKPSRNSFIRQEQIDSIDAKLFVADMMKQKAFASDLIARLKQEQIDTPLHDLFLGLVVLFSDYNSGRWTSLSVKKTENHDVLLNIIIEYGFISIEGNGYRWIEYNDLGKATHPISNNKVPTVKDEVVNQETDYSKQSTFDLIEEMKLYWNFAETTWARLSVWFSKKWLGLKDWIRDEKEISKKEKQQYDRANGE